MIRLQIRFDIVPGRAEEYGTFLREQGMRFWARQPGVIGMASYTTVVGSGPQVVADIDFVDLEAAFRVLTSEEYSKVLAEQARYVQNRQSHLLVRGMLMRGGGQEETMNRG